jgi:hypothetical protein
MNAKEPEFLDYSPPAIVIASGPSLTRAAVDEVCCSDVPWPIIAVNSTAMFRGLSADVIYGGDLMWWKKHEPAARRAQPHASMWTCDRTAAERYGLSHMKGVQRPGLGKNLIHLNGNSGFQAINLAYLFGARRILLLGFDMKPGPNGEKHHHPDHPLPCVQAQTFEQWIYASTKLAEDLRTGGCEVINCTPGSALTVWPYVPLEEALL